MLRPVPMNFKSVRKKPNFSSLPASLENLIQDAKYCGDGVGKQFKPTRFPREYVGQQHLFWITFRFRSEVVCLAVCVP